MSYHLQSLSIRNFRGIDETTQYLSDLKKINLFIGQNNSGKSTVLNLISKYLPLKQTGPVYSTKSDLDALDLHIGRPGAARPTIGFGRNSNDVFEQMVARRKPVNSPDHFSDWLRRIIDALRDDNGFLWWEHEISASGPVRIAAPAPDDLYHSVQIGNGWQQLMNAHTNGTGGDPIHWVSTLLAEIDRYGILPTGSTNLIPAIRQIGAKGVHFDKANLSGTGLIERLAQVQNPELDRRSERLLFDSINGFLKSVTSESSAEIEIPNSKDYVLVHMNGRTLPLSSLGTGIHEIVLIAAFCTLCDQEIICMEEPEIHLHPVLQRKLITYLREHTDNQYFIATHSPTFINTPGAAVHHVKLVNGLTRITRAFLDKEKFEVCLDLGCQASDIVQTNAIIWVEGPSDRIYINHWIRGMDNSLTEGVHYSIMFYGGRLLNHLSADDEEVGEFIKLRALNRHAVVVMDSDKESEQKGVNATKRRIQREFKDQRGITWLTQGREIENYIEHTEIQLCISHIYGDRYHSAANGGKFEHALWFYERPRTISGFSPRGRGKLVKDVDKIKLARKVVGSAANFDVLDLRQKVTQLVRMIRIANQL